jgi:acetyl-CoA C-acetyltransferase
VGAALIAGGEALATQKAAMRAGRDLDWAEDAGGTPELWGVATRGWNDVEDRHRMAGAIYAYPLFENAIRAARGRTIDEHQAAMGELFARFAAVAADNPLADRRDGFSAAEIANVSDANPYIGFPYTRLMNANAFIDQSAALVLTSVAVADDLGVPDDRRADMRGVGRFHFCVLSGTRICLYPLFTGIRIARAAGARQSPSERIARC